MRWETARRKVYAALMDIYRHGNPTKMLKMRKYFESKQNDYIRDTLEYMSEMEVISYSMVSVDEELPPINVAVFCYHRTGRKMVCIRSSFDPENLRKTSNNKRVDYITHWLKEATA